MKTVKKVIISRFNELPLAIINVPPNVQKVRVAGGYTSCGDTVNVVTHKVTANKRALKAAATEPFDLYDAVYHVASDTYQLVKTNF